MVERGSSRGLYNHHAKIVDVIVLLILGLKGLHNGVATRHNVPPPLFLHKSRLGHREDVPGPSASSRPPDVEEAVTVFLRRGDVVEPVILVVGIVLLEFELETSEKSEVRSPGKSSCTTEETGWVAAAAM